MEANDKKRPKGLSLKRKSNNKPVLAQNEKINKTTNKQNILEIISHERFVPNSSPALKKNLVQSVEPVQDNAHEKEEFSEIRKFRDILLQNKRNYKELSDLPVFNEPVQKDRELGISSISLETLSSLPDI
ncbi:Hypothetical predicted protein [Mytilus galloprovincialis]|uniref:Uncharacterized protein n=1 Tax=Mytilus galloprovincialis TaxID=29158 RepID=A0A8B6DIS6_MYTGA|nr:Hypothetical predicted protein [Mytilus galloprovincialis]